MIDLSVLIANSPTSDLAGQNCIENAKNSHKKGMVYLVGAGSGDPELLTLKAWRVMQRAEVVLYDSLVSEDVLDMCASTAEKYSSVSAAPIMPYHNRALTSYWSNTRWQVKRW